ncbi:MAG: hypothetical protein ACE5GW_00845, partial [Planctomycetota bacterium]
LACTVTGSNVALTWMNANPDYDSIEVRRDGVLQATLAGNATSFNDLALADGAYTYSVIAVRGGLSSFAANCGVIVGAIDFIRGDANLSGVINLADVITILNALFGGGILACQDAGDTNDDGGLDISDAIYLLSYLFLPGSPPPPPPHPGAGQDPTPDPLTCG